MSGPSDWAVLAEVFVDNSDSGVATLGKMVRFLTMVLCVALTFLVLLQSCVVWSCLASVVSSVVWSCLASVVSSVVWSCLGYSLYIVSCLRISYLVLFSFGLPAFLLCVGLVLSSLGAVFTWCCFVITSGVLTCIFYVLSSSGVRLSALVLCCIASVVSSVVWSCLGYSFYIVSCLGLSYLVVYCFGLPCLFFLFSRRSLCYVLVL